MPPNNPSQPADWRWSFSRSRLLASCPAAFQFVTYPNKDLNRNKQGINIAALVGISIHKAISTELDNWVRGIPVSHATARTNAREFITQVWNDRCDIIIEIMNGLQEEEKTLDVFLRVANNRIERFFAMIWPQFSHMKHDMHEQICEFHLDQHLIAIKVDLAAWTKNEEFVIVDWKTGRDESEYSSREQLATYVLWAIIQRKLRIDKIVPVIVNLKSGSITRFQPVEEDISYITELVQSDFTKVTNLLLSGEFPASPSNDKCIGCSFLSWCNAGIEIIFGETNLLHHPML